MAILVFYGVLAVIALIGTIWGFVEIYKHAQEE